MRLRRCGRISCVGADWLFFGVGFRRRIGSLLRRRGRGGGGLLRSRLRRVRGLLGVVLVHVLVVGVGWDSRAGFGGLGWWRGRRVGSMLGIFGVRICVSSAFCFVSAVRSWRVGRGRKGKGTDDAMRFFEEFVDWGATCARG